MPNKLVHLDFHEHDSAHALQYLQELVERGQVAGIIFAVLQKKAAPPIFGATGTLATNDIMATGLAAILENQFTQPYLRCAD